MLERANATTNKKKDWSGEEEREDGGRENRSGRKEWRAWFISKKKEKEVLMLQRSE